MIVDTSRLIKGFKTHCGCRRTVRRRNEIEFPEKYLNQYKTCKKCGKEKEYKEFYFREYIDKNKQKQYYFYPKCIECEKARAIEWTNNNIEKKRESCRKNSYKPNIREYHKFNSQRQRDSGYRRNWEENNRDKLSIYIFYKLAHKKHKITDDEWLMCKDYFEYKCAYCGMPETIHKKLHNEQLHKEHAINDGSNGIDNCVPSCKNCNSSKRKQDYTEWYIKSNPVFNKERLHRIEEWLELMKTIE